MCFKISNWRKQLKKLTHFLNKNRIWICSDNCVDGPECAFCSLIYQKITRIKLAKKLLLQRLDTVVLEGAFLC